MKIFYFLLVAIFSIFIGSQITEGVLLVPYWQSLSAAQFYLYYADFGVLIGNFYTILTILAALIPLYILVYCLITKSKGTKFAFISTLFAVIFISFFYLYFKDVNALFFQNTFDDLELKKELIVWSKWHWARVFVECLSLLFLILSISQIKSNLLSYKAYN